MSSWIGRKMVVEINKENEDVLRDILSLFGYTDEGDIVEEVGPVWWELNYPIKTLSLKYDEFAYEDQVPREFSSNIVSLINGLYKDTWMGYVYEIGSDTSDGYLRSEWTYIPEENMLYEGEVDYSYSSNTVFGQYYEGEDLKEAGTKKSKQELKPISEKMFNSFIGWLLEIGSQRVKDYLMNEKSFKGDIEKYKEAYKQMKDKEKADEIAREKRRKEQEEKEREIREKKEKELLEKIEKRFSRVTLGQYEGTDIDWIILEQKKGKALLLSEKILLIYDSLACYDESWDEITWQKCSLRKWLNKKFLFESLSNYENQIIKAQVTADINPDYDTMPGKNTKDKIFLLSVEEVYRYFEIEELRIAYNAFHKPSNWWLRTPGEDSEKVACVDKNGKINTVGENPDSYVIGVRPALWISLDTLN